MSSSERGGGVPDSQPQMGAGEAGSSSPLPLATPASPASSRQMPSQYSQRSEGGSPRLLPRGDIASQGSRILAGAMSPARGGGASMPSTPASSAAGSRAQRRGSPRTDASANTPGGRRTPGSASEGASEPGLVASSEDGGRAVIWGTTVNIQECMGMFRDFLRGFRIEEDPKDKEGGDTEPTSRRSRMAASAGGGLDDGEGDAHYIRMLAEVAVSEVYNLNVDCQHLYDFEGSRMLYDQLVKYPQEVIPIMDLVVHDEFSTLFPTAAQQLQRRIQVRTFNLRSVKRMRDLNPSDISQMVAIRGMVTRTSGIIPDLKVAFFRCLSCGNNVEVSVDRGRIDEPSVCERCESRHSYELVHNRSLFTDRQHVRLQETPESIPDGETPNTVTLYTFDDLVDVVRPGDRVEITGVYRAATNRVNPRLRTVRSVYNTYLDVLHVKKTDRTRLSAEESTAPADSEFKSDFTEGSDPGPDRVLADKRARMLKLARETDDIYGKLAQSLAPSIWELDDVKKGLLCMMFGGTNKMLGAQGKIRGEINVLLCGDPGTSKSQLLTYVNKIAPRGIYTSGKGSSAVGLTAYVIKDPDTRELVLESGALVLSDRGICCIDEFDKMDDMTRSILHEAMEQQTVSIAKAGIVATLNARTSVLASANPVESRWNPQRSVVDNLQLPPTLLSRFDLIYLVLDKVDKSSDARLAKHLVALYHEEPTTEAPTFDMKTLSEYVAFAKTHINPIISDDAASLLVDAYVDMRAQGRQGGRNTITATPRQLESLIRLAEAHARVRMSDTVDAEDVEEARRLMSAATQTAATDPITGAIDMGRINTGRSASAMDDAEMLADSIRDTLASLRGSRSKVTLNKLQKDVQAHSDVPVDRNTMRDALRSLAAEGLVRWTERSNQIVVL